MQSITVKAVTLVGCGIVGRGWIPVFAGAGIKTRLYDENAEQSRRALDWFRRQLDWDVEDGFISRKEASALAALVSVHSDLEEALGDSEYIQESVPENVAVKRNAFKMIDNLAQPGAIIASSSSGLDINEITDGLPGASRCILAHPCNPPFIIPVVEVLPSMQTAPESTEKCIRLLSAVGLKPVKLNFYITDFLVNRIQSAVVREAIYLVESGVADVDAVDSAVRDGLGLRWALLGNFGVNNTNADGGIREYYTRFGESYIEGMRCLDPRPPSFDKDMIERIARGVDRMEGSASIAEICRWRDRLVRKIRRIKTEDPHP